MERVNTTRRAFVGALAVAATAGGARAAVASSNAVAGYALPAPYEPPSLHDACADAFARFRAARCRSEEYLVYSVDAALVAAWARHAPVPVIDDAEYDARRRAGDKARRLMSPRFVLDLDEVATPQSADDVQGPAAVWPLPISVPFATLPMAYYCGRLAAYPDPFTVTVVHAVERDFGVELRSVMAQGVAISAVTNPRLCVELSGPVLEFMLWAQYLVASV
jgi:hypothetical protein